MELVIPEVSVNNGHLRAMQRTTAQSPFQTSFDNQLKSAMRQ